ncbi:MAG: hypothetical protein RBT59_05940 [Arcobacteraceae bacterium]|jgi:hypothetical protein|nr:hypothetical protein [Arcobacteraceae bacterium]
MLEAIALKLITSLTGFLFEGYLDTFKYSKIDGAPSWYGQSGSNFQLVGYGYTKGGIETIQIAQNNCRFDIEKKINKSIEVIIYDNFKHIKDPKEKAFLLQVQNDTTLKIFIEKNVKFEKVEHLKEKKETLFSDGRKYDETFTGCMIDKNIVLEYQKERLTNLQQGMANFKLESASDELDAELGKM